MAEKDPIDEHNLDELLREFYLDEKSGSADEHAAQFVLQQEYAVKADVKKEKQLLEKLHTKRGGSGAYTFYMSALAAIFILLSVVFLLSNRDVVTRSASSSQSQPVFTTGAPTPVTDAIEKIKHSIDPYQFRDSLRLVSRVIVPRLHETGSIFSHGDSAFHAPDNTAIAVNPDDGAPQVPTLTEKDKARYKKIKEIMLQKLVKADKTLYTHIDADRMPYADSMIIIDAFTIRNTVVSNLEYRTFLADLLMVGKKEEYLEAQVLNAVWSSYNCNTLASRYFTDEKYNDFPVVNISPEGAMMFCHWLERETENYIKQNKLKAKPLQMRLPGDAEWIYAAWTGYGRIPYEKGYNTIFDPEEGLVNDAFPKRMEMIRKKVKRSDTLYDLLSVNTYGWTEKALTDYFATAHKRYNAAPHDTIHPLRMKLYSRTYHVSEMTRNRRTEQLWLTGNSWKSKAAYQKFRDEFEAFKASPFAGFRFVIINSNDPEYKNPFW